MLALRPGPVFVGDLQGSTRLDSTGDVSHDSQSLCSLPLGLLLSEERRRPGTARERACLKAAFSVWTAQRRLPSPSFPWRSVMSKGHRLVLLAVGLAACVCWYANRS